MNTNVSGLSPLRGFTLVEVLIALTLFSLILGGLYSALYASGRSWASLEAAMRGNDEQRIGREFIRRRIEQAVPVLIVDGQERRLAFRGDHTILDFVAPLPAHAGGAGLHRLRLSLRESHNDASALVLEYVPLLLTDLDTDEFGEATRTVVLAGSVDGFEIDYYGRQRADEDPAWSDAWRETERLPDYVRLRIESRAADEHWPDVFVPVRAEARRGQPEFLVYADPEER